MKLGSLFDGSGGFPLAAYLNGIEPVWASEIEPFPIRVTTKRFPNMKHIGDVSKIKGSDIEPVDIITFGSPCQSLSVAGKREGIRHTGKGDEKTTQSGLFLEAIRIIKEMREHTNGKYPTFAVWENVCFGKGTLVTTDKGYKEIQDIKQGDTVRTHTGAYRKVLKVHETADRETLEIEINGEPIRVTESHPFLVYGKEWTKAGDLTEEDYVGFTVDKTGKSEIKGAYTLGATIAHSDGHRALSTVKQLPPWIYEATKKEQKAFLKGYSEASLKNRHYVSSSREIAYGIARIIRTVYHESALITKSNNNWVVQKSKDDCFFEDGKVWCKVKSVRKGRKETVYNISVEGEHTYEANGVCVHNCGAYSSNKGEDFRTVLEEFVGIKERVFIPRPPSSWVSAGEVMGTDYSIAWRTFDAQYWGCAQRRRRIYLVADFGGGRAGEILFKPKSLSWYLAQSTEQGKGTAGNAEKSIGATDTRTYNGATVISGNQNPEKGDPCHTLTQDDRNWVVYAVENHAMDSRVKISGEKCQTLTSRMGTGGGNVPLVLKADGFCAEVSAKRDIGYGEEVAPTLRKEVTPAVVCLQGNCVDRDAHCNGKGWREDKSFTLNTVDRHAVCFGLGSAALNAGIEGQVSMTIGENVQPTLIARHPGGVCYCIGNGQADNTKMQEELADTLTCMHDQQAVMTDYVIRRLTPLECCRLQGFPDNWCEGLETENPSQEDIEFWKEVFETHRKIVTQAKRPKTDKQIIKWLQNPYSDSAEYKMWGNGIALPNAMYVLGQITEYEKLHKTR